MNRVPVTRLPIDGPLLRKRYWQEPADRMVAGIGTAAWLQENEVELLIAIRAAVEAVIEVDGGSALVLLLVTNNSTEVTTAPDHIRLVLLCAACSLTGSRRVEFDVLLDILQLLTQFQNDIFLRL